MRQIYLQKQFYQLAKKNILRPGEEAKHREKHIKAWEALRKAGLTAQKASKEIGISRATLYRWQKRLRSEGWQGLEKRSRKPKRVRKKQWSTDLIEGVRSLRCLYPAWGKEKIKVLLEEDGLVCSVSTVGRVIRYLKTHKAIPESVYTKRWKPKRRQKRPYAVRKPKDYAARKPGDIVQVDTLDIHPFPNVHFKHFTARDMVSRWDVVEVYPNASSRQARHFLKTLIQRMPFGLKAIQVDGGSEFEADFELECEKRGIALYILPPKSPKLNGHVERAQRTHTEEFYEVYDINWTVGELNKQLLEWERVYNHVRPHQSLGYLTPAEWLERHQRERQKEDEPIGNPPTGPPPVWVWSKHTTTSVIGQATKQEGSVR